MNHYDTEIDKFSKMAQTWWDPTGPCRPLHLINPVRTAFIQQHLPCSHPHILDVGCGAGLLTEALARTNASLMGIDRSSDLIDVAKAHAQAHDLNIDYRATSIEALSKTHANHFDVITVMELLEHVPEPQALIAHCVTCLKPGGTIFFSTLDRTLKSFLLAIVGAEYILQWLPKGTHDYAHFIRPSELNDMLMQEKTTLMALSGIRLNPITDAVQLTQKIESNYIAAFQKPRTTTHDQ